MNESTLINQLKQIFSCRSRDTVVGPGDDCAVLEFGGKYLLAAADQVIKNVHYLPDTPPEQIATKLLKRNISDIAAMGGIPRWALLTMAVNGRSEEWFQRFFAGLEDCARSYGVDIAGGDLGSLPEDGDCLSLTILGEVDRNSLCLRKNAHPGDFIVVTGQLGNTFNSGHHLEFEPRLAEGRFLAENAFTGCMMDISDGLAADLPKLLAESGCGAEIQLEKIPCRNNCTWQQALSDGEDYELLFTAAADKCARLMECWPFAVPLSVIGIVNDKKSTLIYTENGRNVPEVGVGGYEHFKA